MRKFTYIAAAAIAATSFGLAGCEDAELTQNDRDTARDIRTDDALRDDARAVGDNLEDSARTAGDKMEGAADSTADAARDATDDADATVDMTPDPADPGGPAAGTAAHDEEGVAMDEATAAAPDAEGIRDLLASSTEAALTKGGFDDLVERFVDADRNRIGDFAENEMTELDGLIAAIQQQWQTKYGSEFDISDEALVYNDSFHIQQSELGEARTAAESSVDVDVDADADDASGDVDVQNRTGIDAPGSDAADRNLNDPGRNVATVHVPDSHGLPALTLNLIHELPDAWRIDIPDSIDGTKLQQNLKDHLTAVKDGSAQWPADVNDAYRMVSHHLFMALSDQAMPAVGGSGNGM